MDHLDWFVRDSPDVDEDVAELYRVLEPGASVFWRSAAQNPWYNANFERHEFHVTQLGVRRGPSVAIDRVNMCVDLCLVLSLD